MSVALAASRSTKLLTSVVRADNRVERHRLVQAERLHAVEAALPNAIAMPRRRCPKLTTRSRTRRAGAVAAIAFRAPPQGPATGSRRPPFASPPVISEVILARCDRCLDEVSEATPGPNYRYCQYQQCRGLDDLEARETARPAPNWVIGW